MPPRESQTVAHALRDGAKTIIADSIKKALGAPAGAPATLAHLAAALEEQIHAVAQRDRAYKPAYATALQQVTRALGEQDGPYPDDIVAAMYAAGRRSAADVVSRALESQGAPLDHREVIRRLFVKALMREPAYARDRAGALAVARAAELSCYNASVRTSKESEEPPRRQWDSAPFVDIYSTRCGTIAALLDPDSASCQEYGPVLVGRLLSGELSPDQLGDMTEKELCPQATAAERAEIERRSGQTIQEKESIMFRCPHCGVRRCTYREVQRRSLDEAPDYLCHCLNCDRDFTGRA